MITQERLKEVLDYDLASGLLTWKDPPKCMRYLKGQVAGSLHKNTGYINIMVDKKPYPAHRLAWLYMYRTLPDQIDHINHIRSDNRLNNLRSANSSINGKNQSKSINNTSGVTGVSWYTKSKRWVSKIMVDGERIYLGSFVNFHEAVNARKNAEALYGFHENHGN